MAIVSFIGDGNKETGNTASVIATATYMAIKHNMKILLISTNFNENTIREAFWKENKKRFSLLTSKTQTTTSMQSGIEGLNRVISSNKIEPRIIKDYTNVILRDRFDVLLGYNGDKDQYKDIQKRYVPIITVANQYYDMILVDVDRKLDNKIKDDIINSSDIKVVTTNQRLRDIQYVAEKIEKGEILDKRDIVLALGRYDENMKYNVKNITRNILRKRKLVNSIPYNTRFYEALQEGTVIDLFLDFLRIKNKKDPNYIFIQEVDRLTNSIYETWEEVKVRKAMY